MRETTSLDRFKTRFLYSRMDYNDLTQMPVLPFSLRAIYNATEDLAILQEFLPKLIRHFEWWKEARDPNGTGLVTILHPWESGLDLSPSYDPALHLNPASSARPKWRELYLELLKLILVYKHWYKWDQRKIMTTKRPYFTRLAPFQVQDIAVNSVYAAGWKILGDLALTYSPDLANECYANNRASENAILTNLWDNDKKRFVTGYESDGETRYHGAKTVQILFPLLLDSISTAQTNSIIELMTNESEFWRPAAIPSVSKSEPSYNPVQDTDLLWRGPTWGFTNWFVMEGLEKQGKTDLQEELMDKWLWTAKKSGIWEMYNPDTGEGYGAEGLGMSTLIVDWLQRLGRV